MIRTIDIQVHAERPDFPLCEAVAFVGAPVAVRISNTPRKVGMWEITSVAASIVWPDNSIASVECTREGDAWVGTLHGSSTSGRTTGGFQITANGTSETGETVEGYVLGVGNVCVMNRDMTITVGGVTYYMHMLDSAPETPHKGDVAPINGALKFYDGTAWAAFDERAYVAAMLAQQKADSAYVRAGSAEEKAIRAQDTADDARNVAQRAEVDAVSHAANTTVHVTAAEKATWNGKQSALSAQQLANIEAVPDKADETTPVVQTATLPDECFPITWNNGDSYSPSYYTANKDQCSITPTQGGYQLSAFGIVIGDFGKSPGGVWVARGSGPIYDLMFNSKQPISLGWPQLDFSPSTGGDVVRSTELAAGLEGKADSLSGIGTVGSLDTAMLPGEFLPITFTYYGQRYRLYSASFSVWSGNIELMTTSTGTTTAVAKFDGSTGIYKGAGGTYITDVAFAGIAPVPGKWPFVRLPGQTYGGLVVRSAELAEEMAKKMPAGATGADIPVDASQGAQKISAALEGKANRAEPGHAGNLAKLDSQGNPVDSGKSLDDISREIQDAIEYAVVVDDKLVPTEGPGTSEVLYNPNSAPNVQTFLSNNYPDWSCSTGTLTAAIARNRKTSEPHVNYDSALYPNMFVFWVQGGDGGYDSSFFTRDVTFPANGVYSVEVTFSPAKTSGTVRYPAVGLSYGGNTLWHYGIRDWSMLQTARFEIKASAGTGTLKFLTENGHSGQVCGFVFSRVKVTLVKEIGIEIGDIVAPDADAQTGQAADAKATYEELGALDSRVAALETVMPLHSTVFDESLALIIPAGVSTLYTHGKGTGFASDFRNYFPYHGVWGYTPNTNETNVYGMLMAYNNNNFPNGFVLFNRSSDVSGTGELWRNFHLATSRNVRLVVTLSAKQAKPAAFSVFLGDSSVPVYQYRGPNFTAGESRSVTTDFFLVAAGDGRIRIRGAGVTEFAVTYAKMETD